MLRYYHVRKHPYVSAWESIIQKGLERAATRQQACERQLKVQKRFEPSWAMPTWFSLLPVWVEEPGQAALQLLPLSPKNWARSPLVLSRCLLRLKAHSAGA